MNNTPDLAPLIKGVLVIVGIALALGQYPKLETWARAQAIEAVAWKEPLPYFFAPAHQKAHPHIHSHLVEKEGQK